MADPAPLSFETRGRGGAGGCRIQGPGPAAPPGARGSTRAPHAHVPVCVHSNVGQLSMMFVFFTASPYAHLVDRLCVLVAAMFVDHHNWSATELQGTAPFHPGGFFNSKKKKLVCPVVSKICTAPTDGT